MQQGVYSMGMMTPDQRAVFNAAYRIGIALDRKFEVSDLTPELRQAARLYAASYDGDFPFMVEMRDTATAGVMFFSDGQSKAILNCLMGDAKRRLAAKPKTAAVAAPAGPNVASIPDGRYRVTLADGSDLALRFDSKNEWTIEKFGEGTRKINLRTGGSDSEREWTGVGTASASGAVTLWKSAGPRVREAVQVLADASRDEQGWLIAGLAFAQEGSRCFRCGKELDQPESLLVGYGETCAAKLGLPWGKTAIPMSVRLAQASQAAAPAASEPAYTREEEDEFMALANAPVAAPVKEETADQKYARYVERSNRIAAQAKAEGRPRTYDEIFGDDD